MEENIQIKNVSLSVAVCEAIVEDQTAGAIVHFIGTVRNNTNNKKVIKLEFEAYKAMALKEMRKIGEAAKQKFDILDIAIHHREGTCLIGDIAVVIAVSSAHRKAAFKACEFAIDTLKETVPIWKKEFFEDGEVWVNATP